MSNQRTEELTEKLTAFGGLFDYGPQRSRLLVQIWRVLATGRPVTQSQVDSFVSELDITPEEADQFLRQMSEWRDDDNIVGIMGLSLNDHPHKFTVGDVQLATWCAADTLFLPAMLGATATVESESPASKETVRVTIGPDAVLSAEPADAVISIVVPKETDMTSVAQISMTFCSHIFFFASRSEAEQWSEGRDDIEILSLDEGYHMMQQLWAGVLSSAQELPAVAGQG